MLTKLFFASVLLTGSSFLFADTITVNDVYSGSVWQNWDVAQLSNLPVGSSQKIAGQPYWNNSSIDGRNGNIGGCLAVAGSPCAVPSQPGTLPFLGRSNGKAFVDFQFTNTIQDSISLQAQVTSLAAYETFGWYNTDNPTQRQVLFSGASMVGNTITFAPTTHYGFFFTNSAARAVFYTNATKNTGADLNLQHFAAFQSVGGYYLGVEDAAYAYSDMDYNDVLVKVSAVPEPMSMFLLGVGLLGIGVASRRSKKRA